MIKSLQAWLEIIEASHPSEIEMGLERTLTVYSRLRSNFSSKSIAPRVVLVAGTNGKGSTIAMLERLLINAGQTVGVYTSPHIHQYNERIRINGKNVDDQRIVQSFERVEAARKDIPLTYFEFGTLGALSCLEVENLDIVLLEVGLGGRLDAVNIVDPDLAIITSIDIDHIDWLGSDRESIGFEKAGILRPGIPAIYGEKNPPESICQQVLAQKVNMLYCQQHFGLYPESEAEAKSNTGFILDKKDNKKDIKMPDCLLPENNVLIALQAMECLDFSLNNNIISESLDGFVVEGRLEVVSDAPIVMMDVGHNPHASRFLAHRLKALAKGSPVYAVFSVLADKDIEGIVSPLSTLVSEWHIAPLECARAKGISDISRVLTDQKLEFTEHQSLSDAYDQARYKASKTGIVICFGSFYVVSELHTVSELHAVSELKDNRMDDL